MAVALATRGCYLPMIATARTRWIVAIAVAGAVLGIFMHRLLVVQLGTACLIWVGFEWIAFRYRIDVFVRGITAQRAVCCRQGITNVLWVGQTVNVRTTVKLPRGLRWIPVYGDLQDLLPMSAEFVSGDSSAGVPLGAAGEVTMSYQLKLCSAGVARFAGLRLLLSDLHGFFHAERLVQLPEAFRVLPPSMEAGPAMSIRKRANALAPPGIHVVARAGVGSELLELREYASGDPPRSIAWKVSARRGTLMSKQFENEVPVRSHLLIDMSRSVRIGYPGPCPASRLVDVAATITQTLAVNRDPVGVTLLDGQSVSVTRPSASRQTVLRMLDRLSSAIDRPIPPVAASPETFLQPALDVARICHPLVAQEAAAMFRGLRILPRQKAARMRLQVAAVLASYHRMGPMAVGRLAHNDRRLSAALQSFLTAHDVPYLGPTVDHQGAYLFDDSAKIAQMASIITKTVTHGRDNELFVLMAELLDREYPWSPLLQAIRVARARHHRVVVLCARPAPGLAGDGPNHTRAEWPAALAKAANQQRQQAAYDRLRRELGKLRVPVAAVDHQATRLVLRQLELVRSGRGVV